MTTINSSVGDDLSFGRYLLGGESGGGRYDLYGHGGWQQCAGTSGGPGWMMEYTWREVMAME